MRIVSGKYRGRAINPPKNLRARPTTDFAKENLFNVLGNLVDFEECDVLDLFAGTGSISYEFASRGVRQRHFGRNQSRTLYFIKKRPPTWESTICSPSKPMYSST